ncbi:MAG: U3 snoRNP protein [Trizodia sp. TS-e1964]|nr:MAG: U3 snoRNP protein [Trizodia sp. TS-e1964]
MAGASDKARYYLERSVPELQEYERKGIFSKAGFLCTSPSSMWLANAVGIQTEIRSISKTRSDFEHKLFDRGSQPTDYVRYIEFELNLESLKRKRVARLGVRVTNHLGKRRVFFILDRATRAFPGDLSLWTQYIEYCRKEKSTNKISEIFTSALRFHPTKSALWIYAARYFLESEADMTSARSYMQRGLRFCRTFREMWMEYARLEMIQIAKIAARQTILGLDRELPDARKPQAPPSHESDVIALPAVTAEDVDPSLRSGDDTDQDALQNLNSTPILKGAIPMAIFDAAFKNFEKDLQFGLSFFDMVMEFKTVPCLKDVTAHIPVAGVLVNSADFPPALAVSLERLKSSQEQTAEGIQLNMRAIDWLLALLRESNLDASLHKALVAVLGQCVQRSEKVEKCKSSWKEEIMARVIKLREAGFTNLAQRLDKVKSEIPV